MPFRLWCGYCQLLLSRSTRKSTSGSKDAKGVRFGDEKGVRELRGADKKG